MGEEFFGLNKASMTLVTLPAQDPPPFLGAHGLKIKIFWRAGFELGRCRKSAPLQVEEQLPPGLRALAHAVDQADQLLLAFRCRSDDQEQTLRLVFQSRKQARCRKRFDFKHASSQ